MRMSAPGGVSDRPDAATRKSQNGERLTAYLEDAHGALSGHTVRAVRADLERFAAWCAEWGRSPLPARAGTVVAYVEAMASERAPATVRRYVSSVATVHKAAGERSPLEHVTVRRALKRMHRQRGCRQRQVRGLTWALRRRLMEAAGDRVIDVRNRAILAVAYDAMLRRSELVALQVVDVTIDRGGSASLLVRRAKTDPEGGGAMLYLHRDSVRLLSEWLSASGISGGPLFRSMRKDGTLGGRLHESQVPRIYKAMAERAGLPEHREVAAAIRTARASTVPLAVRLAFECLVLTAARWGEVRWAEWTEIDRENGVWTVPARRTKSNREHRVPLCGRAVEILDEARSLVEGTSPFLFPHRVGKQLEEKQLRRMFRKHGIAAVPHGFRSSFRDWAAEETDHPREVI